MSLKWTPARQSAPAGTNQYQPDNNDDMPTTSLLNIPMSSSTLIKPLHQQGAKTHVATAANLLPTPAQDVET
jgi:hypothetical protein